MRICSYKGLVVAVLTRNEHCPPHAHVGNSQWDARFTFSFWHNGVQLWDVRPARHEPDAALLEMLRQTLKQADHLRKARELWWNSKETICVDKQQWDLKTEEVVSPKAHRPGVLDIVSARFDARRYATILQLAGQLAPVEIEL